MKMIPLTKGKYTIVGNEDFDYLSQFKWHLSSKGYAVRNIRIPENWIKREAILMHRVVLKRKGVSLDNLQTDHINRDKLDNRRLNLRAVTDQQNSFNRGMQLNNKTGYAGVSYFRGKWVSKIGYNNKRIHLGTFINKSLAVRARKEAELVYFTY